jgi:NADH-quinone oxidoreductase subunit K
MNEVVLLQNYLVVGAILFATGLVGFITRRNLIVMFLSAELMLQGVSINLVAWGRYHNNWDGQMLVIFIIAIAACESAIALALILMLFQRAGNLDATSWQHLREDNQPPFVDDAASESIEDDPQWPKLTPAGPRPETDPTETPYRSNV